MKLNFLVPSLLTLPSAASSSIREYLMLNLALNAFAYDSVDTNGLQGLLQNYTPLVPEFQCSSWLSEDRV